MPWSIAERLINMTKSQTDSAIDGAIAGIVSRSVIAPLDVIKIRLQVQNSFYKEYSGIWDCVRKVYRREGIMAFWKGNSSGLALYGGFGACQFFMYEQLQKTLQNSFMSGGLAASFATVVTYPFDTIRTQMAIKTNRASPIEMMKSIIDNGGLLRGLFKGLTPTVAQVAPYMGTVFACHHYINPVLQTHLPSSVSDFISGASAGVLGKLVTMPFDTLRKRMQIQSQEFSNYEIKKLQKYITVKHCIAYTWLNEGIRGFYRGLTIALCKSVPGTATTFMVYGLMGKMKNN